MACEMALFHLWSWVTTISEALLAFVMDVNSSMTLSAFLLSSALVGSSANTHFGP
jgi:hypothetical protein